MIALLSDSASDCPVPFLRIQRTIFRCAVSATLSSQGRLTTVLRYDSPNMTDDLAHALGRHFDIDFSWPMAIALISAVPCFTKQVISVVQLVNASNALVDLDREERAEAFKKANA